MNPRKQALLIVLCGIAAILLVMWAGLARGEEREYVSVANIVCDLAISRYNECFVSVPFGILCPSMYYFETDNNYFDVVILPAGGRAGSDRPLDKPMCLTVTVRPK